MSIRRSALFAFVLVSCLTVGVHLTSAYVTNSQVYTPPDYTTFTPPPAGGSYIDPVFGTAIKRLSDAMHTPDAGRDGVVTMIGNEYSTMSPFNSDNTRLLLVHLSYFALYDGDGNFLQNLLQYGINASSEPRWSRADPNVFYYVAGNQLRTFNVGTLITTVVHTFDEYTRVSGMWESDISFDGNSVVLAGDNRYVFVYDIPTDTEGPVFDAGSNPFDNLYLTPDNHVIVSWYARGWDRFNGIELFDRDMNFLRQLAHAAGHMDVTRDTNGEEVLLWVNAADTDLQVPCTAGVTKIRLSDATQTCVWSSADWGLAVHVSAPDGNGWFFMETYAAGDPIPPTNWKVFTDEILQVRLDGSEVRRLAHHRSRPFDSYAYQPKVATNRDGTKLVYSSNFGLQAVSGYPEYYCDTYLIDLSSIVETTPPPITAPMVAPRVEENAADVAYTGLWYANVRSYHSGNSAVLAMTSDARATFSFSGTGASWIAYTDEWSGIANVYVDDVFQGQVDTYASPAKASSKVFEIGGLSSGPHTLTIEVTGTRNPASGGRWVWIDAFDVTPTEPAQRN